MTDEEFISALNRNSKRLFLIALSFTKSSEDAEDILQNTFLKLWSCNKAFEDSIHTDKWLTAVCVNESKNFIKSPFRRRQVELTELSGEFSFDSDTSEDIFKSVMSLSPKERTVIHLYYYEDMSVRDIAELLKLSESTVKIRLHRARNNMKKCLGDEWINE